MDENVLRAIQDAVAMLRSPGFFDFDTRERTSSILHDFLQEELKKNPSDYIRKCNDCNAKAVVNKNGLTQCGKCLSFYHSCCD